MLVNLFINVHIWPSIFAGYGVSFLTTLVILLEILLNIQHIGDLVTLDACVLSLNIIILPLLLLSNGRGSATLHILFLAIK